MNKIILQNEWCVDVMEHFQMSVAFYFDHDFGSNDKFLNEAKASFEWEILDIKCSI